MSEQLVGAEIAGYRIESVIGRGGMAVVYRAEDTRLGRKVALKLLTSALSDQSQFQQRFIQESRLAASLDHPNIIPIYEAGNADGTLFIAMRYVVGADLKVLIRGGPRMPPERVLGLVEQIGDALDAAHQLGLVHRDVKPGNVLLTSLREQTDHVYLTDFGLTKRASSLTGGLTGTGNFLGTIDYVAPEQIAGKAVDARTDIYALGCVLHECLTGRVPFGRDDDAATLWAHLVDPPPPISAVRGDLPPAVNEVVARAMAKSPDDRYATCHELVVELRDAFELAPLGWTDPTSGRSRAPESERDPAVQKAAARSGHPSFPPGTFPPLAPSSSRAWTPAHRAGNDEPDAPGDEDAASAMLTGEETRLGRVGDEVEAGTAPNSDSSPRRSLIRRYRWAIAALVVLAAASAASLVALTPSRAPGLYTYTGGSQFSFTPFTLRAPVNWRTTDASGVDATLSPGGQAMADLMSHGHVKDYWPAARNLVRSSPRAVGVWISAASGSYDPTSWQDLQTVVGNGLPLQVSFDGGYEDQKVGGMPAEEMNGKLVDPDDRNAALRFVIDVVQYRKVGVSASVWVLFFAPEAEFAHQQTSFSTVRNSLTFS